MSAPYHSKALPEGTILREWRLEEVLGVGGFGIVYRGKDIHFGESVAIKEYFPGSISDRIDGTTVTPTDSSSEEIYQLGRQKFMEEAKVLWNLSRPQRHPNLVSVRSLFEIHGTAYMVMDFEKDVSLSQMLKEGKRFDDKGLLAIIRPIAEGLEKAHQAGVLHRDIKPANILINQDGRPVLIDFGSARFESSQATNTKVTFYTPPYAAVEQYVKSFPQGPWTDIYALGVVLYQCITGEKPAEVLERMHGEDDNLLSSRQWPGFSPSFIRAVDAAMAVRPLERPATVSAWLKMFDAADPAPVDEPTRIARVLPQPAGEAPAAALPEPVTMSRQEPVTLAERMITPAMTSPGTMAPTMTAAMAGHAPHALPAEPQQKRASKLVQIVLGGAALVVILAAAGFFLTHRSAAIPAPAAVATATIAAPVPAAQPAPANSPLPAKMDALIDAARKAGRRDSEITALTAAKSKLADLIAARADAGQLATAAADMAKAEEEILGRAERRMWRDVGTPPDANAAAGSADVTAKLEQAKTDLDAKLKTSSSQDAGMIIDDTRQAITSYTAFQDAYTAAMPVYVAAKHKAFDDLHTATLALFNQVITLANVDKPWFLASSARKDAYKLRQDNAAQAKTLSGQLDDLSKNVAASNDLNDLATAMDQAAAANKTANTLYAASYAAKP